MADAATSSAGGDPGEALAAVRLARAGEFSWQTADAGATPRHLLIRPEEEVEALVTEILAAEAIGLQINNFGDGRIFTQARKIRETQGFRGLLVAVGAFLPDQVQFLVRCGVNVFAPEDPAALDKQRFATQVARYSVFYQPAGGGL
jgi:uncharacterized protein (DUF934 family)